MTRLRPIPTVLSVLALAAAAPAAAQAYTCDSSTQSAGDAQVTQRVCGADYQPVRGNEFSGQVGTVRLTSTAYDVPERDLTDHDVQIDWGDGTTSAGYLAYGAADPVVRGAHTFADNGHHDVRVTVTSSGTYHGVALSLTDTATSNFDVSPPPPAYLSW